MQQLLVASRPKGGEPMTMEEMIFKRVSRKAKELTGNGINYWRLTRLLAMLLVMTAAVEVRHHFVHCFSKWLWRWV